MGISERDYQRTSAREGGMLDVRMVSFNTWLIIANVAVFVMQVMTTRMTAIGPSSWIEEHGYFSTAYLLYPHLQVWRLVTFQFIHGNITHIFFNMFGLWVFGGMVERHMGFKRYAAFYLVCGVCGGLMYLMLNLAGVAARAMHLPQLPFLLYERADTPLVGASAGVFGVIMACAYIAPNAVVQLMIPPVPIRLKVFAYGYVAIAAFSVLFRLQNAGGDAAHLGGAIAGYFFIRNSHLLHDFFDVFGDSRRSVRGPDRASVARPFPPARRRGPTHAEVDRILDKVRDEGLDSLSDAERRALRDATDSQRRW